MITKVFETLYHSEFIHVFFRGIFRLVLIAAFFALFAGVCWLISWVGSLLNPMYVFYAFLGIIAFLIIMWIGAQD